MCDTIVFAGFLRYFYKNGYTQNGQSVCCNEQNKKYSVLLFMYLSKDDNNCNNKIDKRT